MGEKVHVSIRVPAETAARVEAQRAEGESMAAAYVRAISAGLDALEGVADAYEDPDETVGGDHGGAPGTSSGEVEALRANLADLRDHAATLEAQLAAKDRQIEQAQAVAAAAVQAQAAQAEASRAPAKRSLWQRIKGALTEGGAGHGQEDR